MHRLTNDNDARRCEKTKDGNYPSPSGQAAFNVAGAGTFLLGQWPCLTGGACGLSFDVSWGKYGYSGGVIDRKELTALRDYINAYLENTHKVECDDGQE